MTPAKTEEKQGQQEQKSAVSIINERQQQAFDRFCAELKNRRPDVYDELFPDDNKENSVSHEGDRLVIDMRGTRIEIGRGGGFNLPEIRSYRNGFTAAIAADLLRANQDGNVRAPRGSGMSREEAALFAEARGLKEPPQQTQAESGEEEQAEGGDDKEGERESGGSKGKGKRAA